MTDKHQIKLELRRSVRISKWKVEEGTIVYDGRVLLLYDELLEEECKNGTVVNQKKSVSNKLKSKNVGTVHRLAAKEGDIVKPGDVLLEIDIGCHHPTVINDLCAECGADLQKDGQTESQATIPMVHSIPQLKVSHEQAQKIGKADTERLLRDRKLVLLVDLDQTLIHTTHDPIPNNLKDVHHFQLGPGPASPWYHTRLRPGTDKFLRSMALKYELHICTFGVRPYAHTIARILDPDGSLFASRILSRDECFDSETKSGNLEALFPCGDELVCIIDDREDVWKYSPNLIQVKNYLFFRNVFDVHDPQSLDQRPIDKDNYLAPGVYLKKEKRKKTESKNCDDDTSPEGETKEGEKPQKIEDEEEDIVLDENGMIEVEDEDDYLLYLGSILKRVHKKFYKVFDKQCEGVADVKWIISDLRGSVLSGCTLVFSGLVPLNVSSCDSHAANMARRLGAQVDEELSEKTTHLVAAARGTAKVHQAKKMKHVKIVTPHWLVNTANRWEKVNEKLFELGTATVPLCKQLMYSSKDCVQNTLGSEKDLPQFLTLSKEDMDEMALEVNEDEDSEDDLEDTKDNGDEEDDENGDTTGKFDGHHSCSSSSGNEEMNGDGEEEWSQLGAEIEKELSDVV